MEPTTTELSFDRASFTAPDVAGQRCTSCKADVGDEYFTWQQRIVCARCRD